MKKAFFAQFLLLSCSFLLSARDDLPPLEDREVPPAPVVSDLRADIDGNTVTLSWTPAPDVSGDNIILRSDRPITAANFFEAERIGSVPVSVTQFTDTIASGKDYYYAILSKDGDGTYYEFFLPASNSLLIGITPPEAVPEVPPAEIAGFDAVSREDAVIVSWKYPAQDRTVLLYRSTSPFTDMSSLVQAVLVAGFADSGAPYVDYPIPGIPYYYGILDEAAVRSGTATFADGANTNPTPVEIPSTFLKTHQRALTVARAMPLPWLNPANEISRPPRRFGKKTESMIRALASAGTTKRPPERVPFIFRSDLTASAGGEEYALKRILETGFASKNWDATVTELEKFLAIRRSPETTARARFYIGEACCFSGNYDRALLEFLLAKDKYYNQSNEWIQYVLNVMATTES